MSNITHTKKFMQKSRQICTHLQSRGYQILAQKCIDGYLSRNAPWKTYWEAEHLSHGKVFIKVNYGYADPDTNAHIGIKEALLPEHFSKYFRKSMNIRFPRVFDHWAHQNAYFVVYRYTVLSKISLFSLLLDGQHINSFYEFTDIWTHIPKPQWWNNNYELHDFALHNSLPEQPKYLSPFGFDLDDNLAIDEQGKLFVNDFEFVQWTRLGLQQVYLLFRILSYRKFLLNAYLGKYNPAVLSNQIVKHWSAGLINQAAGCHMARLERNQAGPQSRLLHNLARHYIKTRLG